MGGGKSIVGDEAELFAAAYVSMTENPTRGADRKAEPEKLVYKRELVAMLKEKAGVTNGVFEPVESLALN